MNKFSKTSPLTGMDKPKPFASQLGMHEWLAITSILGFLLLLTLIVLDGRHDSRLTTADGVERVHFLKQQEVEIHIEGSVKNPGRYKVKSGTSVMEAIKLAEPFEEVDFSKIKSTTIAKNGSNIRVISRQMLEITVLGAVKNPGILKIPKGTRLIELGKYVEYTEDADLSKMAKKRFLKDNEKIIVTVVNASSNTPQELNQSDKPIKKAVKQRRRTRRIIEAQKHTQRLWSR